MEKIEIPKKQWKHTQVDLHKIYEICNEQERINIGDGFFTKKACLEFFYIKCIKDVYMNRTIENRCHEIINEYEKIVGLEKK